MECHINADIRGIIIAMRLNFDHGRNVIPVIGISSDGARIVNRRYPNWTYCLVFLSLFHAGCLLTRLCIFLAGTQVSGGKESIATKEMNHGDEIVS